LDNLEFYKNNERFFYTVDSAWFCVGLPQDDLLELENLDKIYIDENALFIKQFLDDLKKYDEDEFIQKYAVSNYPNEFFFRQFHGGFFTTNDILGKSAHSDGSLSPINFYHDPQNLKLFAAILVARGVDKLTKCELAYLCKWFDDYMSFWLRMEKPGGRGYVVTPGCGEITKFFTTVPKQLMADIYTNVFLTALEQFKEVLIINLINLYPKLNFRKGTIKDSVVLRTIEVFQNRYDRSRIHKIKDFYQIDGKEQFEVCWELKMYIQGYLAGLGNDIAKK
jgi:hypothetical protein